MSVTGPTRRLPVPGAMAQGQPDEHLIFFHQPGSGSPPGSRLTLDRESVMAATRKTAKRGSRKKATKKSSATRKASSKRRAKSAVGSRAASLKRKAKKGLKAARSGLKTVRQAGEKTWKRLTTTTAHVVDEIKKR